MYYHSSVAYDNDVNAAFIIYMNDIGIIKQSQLNIGAGYTYNFVPCKGLLINASGLRDLLFAEKQNPSGDMDGEEFGDLFKIRFEGMESQNSRMRLNLDARLSVTYNFGNWFVNAYGQFCNFRYRYEETRGRLRDWYVNASIGLRL